MLVALVSFHIYDLDIEKNLKNLSSLIEDLSDSVDWVIFPEMFLTGFDFSVFKHHSYAEFCKKSKAKGLNFMHNLAKQKSCAVEGSLLVEDNGSFFNRHYFITSYKEYFYDKMKLFSLSDESKYLVNGNKHTIAEFQGWKINLKTCYDLRFSDICKNKYAKSSNISDLNEISSDLGTFNYDIITFVASWPQSRSEQWKILLQARAIENQSYVIGVNRQGNDSANIIYGEDSCVIDCKGKFVQEVNQTNILGCKTNKYIHYYNIEKQDLDKQREKFPVYSDW